MKGDELADGEELFRRAMRNVAPVSGARRIDRRRRRAASPEPSPEPPTAFRVERFGEQIEGLAADASSRELRRLRRGEVAIDARVDLHGLSEAEARSAVRELVLRCWRQRRRGILIVHGRGLRSPQGPVLKTALPGWLTSPPLAGRVLAFTSAGPDRGGAGATLVLLRRHRPLPAP